MGQRVWSMNEHERKYGTILMASNGKPRGGGDLILWERLDRGLSEDNVEGRWEGKIQKGC